MSTNGDSARRWLEENRTKVTEQRILQIRDSLLKKIQGIEQSEDDDVSDEYDGLLEALEVMESWLQENTTHFQQEYKQPHQQEQQQQTAEQPSAELDYGPLGSNDAAPAPILSDEEKHARFKELLESSKQ